MSTFMNLCLLLWLLWELVHSARVRCTVQNMQMFARSWLESRLWSEFYEFVLWPALKKSTTVSLWHWIARNQRTSHHLTCKQWQKEGEENTGTKTINASNYSNCIVLFVFFFRYFHLNKLICQPFWFRWSK